MWSLVTDTYANKFRELLIYLLIILSHSIIQLLQLNDKGVKLNLKLPAGSKVAILHNVGYLNGYIHLNTLSFVTNHEFPPPAVVHHNWNNNIERYCSKLLIKNEFFNSNADMK